ncbi:MAG: hypothetical protein AAGG46_06630, partial [Planctomycetota bacterium]
MPSDNQTRTRSQRVAAVHIGSTPVRSLLDSLQRGSVVLRLSLCGLAALTLWAATAGWRPPREFRSDQVPTRDVIAR